MNERTGVGAASASGNRVAVTICVVAGAVACAGAWLRPVWHDELYTLVLARLPFRDLVSALIVDSGPPLHYLLCHILHVLVGWPEGSTLGTVIVRLPSVLAFALVPWVVWRGRPVSAGNVPWGPMLTIVWLPMVYFGTEARAYALLALVNALVWIRGQRWIEGGGGGAVRFAAAASCLPLLHYTGWASFLTLPALALFLSRPRRRVLGIALACAAVPGLLWLPVMLGAPRAAMGWLATASGPGRPGLATVTVMAPAGPFPALFETPPLPVPAWASVGILSLVVAGMLIGAVRLRHDDSGAFAWRDTARLGIGLLPVVALGLAALVGIPLYFAGRTESMVWALAVSLVVILTSGLPKIVRRVLICAYLLVGTSTVALWLAAMPGRPPAPGVEVGRELAARVHEGDRVVVAGLWQLEVCHGLAEGALASSSRAGASVDVETVPRSQATHPGWFDRAAAMSPGLLDDARALRDSCEAAATRIWLVWSPALPLEENFFPAFAGWHRSRVGASPIIAVDLLVPPVVVTSPPGADRGGRRATDEASPGREATPLVGGGER